MSKENHLNELGFSPCDNKDLNYEFTNVFKNPNNLPLNQIHLEREWYELDVVSLGKSYDSIFATTDEALQSKYSRRKTEVIPALDKRWLPKLVFYNFEPCFSALTSTDNITFLTNNKNFSNSLNYFLACNFHQFWCTIFYNQNAAQCISSFILNAISPFESQYLPILHAQLFRKVFHKFLLVYKRLITFKESSSEYIPQDLALSKLLDQKLINLPSVLVLASLYKDFDLSFVNQVTSLYFNDDTSQLDFKLLEVNEMLKLSEIILEMIGGHICGFDSAAVIVPISIEPRPKIFRLQWVFSVVNYLLNTVRMLNILMQFHKPAVEIAFTRDLPYRLPYIYGRVYKEINELLSGREELEKEKNLTERIIDEINMGRMEFVNLYHAFVSHCLEKALENIHNSKQQEQIVEDYLKLLNTALEDEYFICDYNSKYNVASSNEMFESCCPLDTTRTKFIESCINKLPRHKKLDELSKCKIDILVDIFKKFKPFKAEEHEVDMQGSEPGPSGLMDTASALDDNAIDTMIASILDMFPHLGDGFVLKCLEAYNFNLSDLIDAIVEENLAPHLYEIPFEMIRIPPEPEPERPILAYKGKKPGYKDAIALLDDKESSNKAKVLNYMQDLEGIQYKSFSLYEDEYDDRYDDDVAINVGDNIASEEHSLPTSNPNRNEPASDSSSSDEEYVDHGKNAGATSNGFKRPFCEDPAIVRARREAQFQSKRGNHRGGPSAATGAVPKRGDVVGNAKGQGQDKSVLQNRAKKGASKGTRANHNRKGGAQFKRNKGMIT